MRSAVLRVCGVASVVALAHTAQAQVTRADYERAAGLRARYEALVTNVPDSATWIGETSRFWYRRTVKGGAEFVLVDAASGEKRAPFDHARLATALSGAAGGSWTALTLPFNTFRFVEQERAIEVQVDQTRWTCVLADYRCTRNDRQGTDPPAGALRGVNGPVRGPHRHVVGRASALAGRQVGSGHSELQRRRSPPRLEGRHGAQRRRLGGERL